MTTLLDYALMAGASYVDTRALVNQFPAPKDWAMSNHQSQDSGFEAVTFKNGSEIVISFAGTYPGDISGDIAADLWLATGVGSLQLFQAAQYYLSIKNDPQYQGCNITLTGHSLGGGLAALVGVFFGVPATTFDQAPFKNSAQDPSLVASNNPLNLLSPNVAANLKADLLVSGYTETQLNDLTTFLQYRQTQGGIPNSDLITNTRVDGEFLSAWYPANAFDTIGARAADVIQHAPTSVIGSDLHAQSLLIAMLQSGDTPTSTASDHTLGQVTFKLTDLLAMIFDKKLFAHDTDPNSPDANLLEHLVRHEAGVAADPVTGAVAIAADAMVTRFTKDLWKLAQTGGLTMGESATYSNWNNVSKTLIAFAMQKYYDEKSSSTGVGEVLFKDVSGSGGIQFDTEAVAGKGNSITSTSTKGYSEYFIKYLDDTSLLPSEEKALIKSLLPQLRDEYVQAGTTGMDATDTLNRGAFMLGGTGVDTLTGGTGNDLLVGNSANDEINQSDRMAA